MIHYLFRSESRLYYIATIPCGLLLVLFIGLCKKTKTEDIVIYVSINGSDDWTGRSNERAFATLERACEEIYKLDRAPTRLERKTTVVIGPGTYTLTRPLELTEINNGAGEQQVTFAPASGATVRLSGIKKAGPVRKVTTPEILAKLKPEIQAHLYQCSLAEVGHSEAMVALLNGISPRFDGKSLRVTRYPRSGFLYLKNVIDNQREVSAEGSSRTVQIELDDDRSMRWSTNTWVSLHGYWAHDWADGYQEIDSISESKPLITLKAPWHSYGYERGQWFYAFNILSEISVPGDCCIDVSSKTLYFYPPGAGTRSELEVAGLYNLLKIKRASNIRFVGIKFDHSAGNAIEVSDSSNITIENCEIADIGGWGVTIDSGTNNQVIDCLIHDVGDGGVSLYGGDRKTLSPSSHRVLRTEIYNYARIHRTYKPGILLSGVGNEASHNIVHNAPHCAIMLSGNDNKILNNEIYDVCLETSDSGAVYCGRDWTMRGNVVGGNYIHDVRGLTGRGGAGVYADDQFSGIIVSNNLFSNVNNAVLIGGGRDCRVAQNIFLNCSPAVRIDSRGLRASPAVKDDLMAKLGGVPYQTTLWSERYPELRSITLSDPMAPEGDYVAGNVCSGGQWETIDPQGRRYVGHESNLVEPNANITALSAKELLCRDCTSETIQRIKLLGYRAKEAVSQKSREPDHVTR